MYCEEANCFWFPLLLTIVTIVLSSIAFPKLLNNRAIQPSVTQIPIASSSSATDSVGEYEVFLSFRGEDTRKGFTDFLYTYLVGANIRTFRDDNELRIGEKIGPDLLKAIKESKISIPIFSKNYASSKWCLHELAQMVECQENEGQKIFPIFYDVDASDVRNQRGDYEKAFQQHKKNFDEKTVQVWKDALTNVGQLKGYELVKETNGHEGELVKKVVREVLLHLKKNYTHVPDDLVGMTRHLEEMTGLLHVDFEGVRVVGIHGMGGIGKTTIAKVIYNQLCERFECCCFLEDVREKAKKHHNCLVNLQNLLASKILKTEFPKIIDVDDGINRIKDAVYRKKVLFVLDDVDEKSQFDKLAGECDWFGRGSRIIVTTRNKEVLNTLEVTYKKKGLLEVYRSYEPELMDPIHSLQLFSKYAFMRDSPPEDYVVLSKEVVSTAAGLPLVLVSLGSSLFSNEDTVLWKEKLRELEKIPQKDVLDKLRISFEALNDQEKKIFLDIACIFIGDDKENPYYMWDDCEFYPRNGINALVLRSLMKVGDDNTLRMHDQLQDLGRQIVRAESMNEPGERSRLWHHEEGLDVLERHMGTKNVEALCLDLSAEKIDWAQEGNFDFRSSDNRSFYRSRCLVGEDFRQLPNLRFLRVGKADLDGDFKHFLPNLRWLRWGCWGNFTPSNFHLKNLVILDLSGSRMTDDWEGWSEIKMAKKLKVLNLSHCYGLERAPNLSTFSNLEVLNLSYGRYWKEIDSSIRNLINLRVLDLSDCWCIKSLDCCMFVALENLNLHNCQDLCRLDGLEKLESLRFLDLSSCGSLEKLPNFSSLIKLKTLKIGRCRKVSDIQGLDKLESLELLEMRFCSSVERLPGLQKLGMLKELDLFGCDKLVEVEGLTVLESLERLDLSKCISLSERPDLFNLKRLKQLIMGGFKDLIGVRGLEELQHLELLDISSCRIEKSPDLSKLKSLKEINTTHCSKLTEIWGLEELKSLEVLNIGSCPSIENLPDLSNLPNLRSINVFCCAKLTEIRGLLELKSLSVLDIQGCKSLGNLPNLPNTRVIKKNELRRPF